MDLPAGQTLDTLTLELALEGDPTTGAVVVAGHAEVLIEGVVEPLVLAPGTLGRLAAGTRTTWTVTEALRKVYLLGR